MLRKKALRILELSQANWGNITLPLAKYVVEQAQEVLGNIADDVKLINTQALAMLSFLSASLTMVIAVHGYFHIKVLICMMLGIALSMLLLLITLLPRGFMGKGSCPDNILDNESLAYDELYFYKYLIHINMRDVQHDSNKLARKAMYFTGAIVTIAITAIGCAFLVCLQVVGVVN
ncbi:hypothetical protein [Cysteiniphilum halobium]|uniref:hypothetical protein n=1 Tax=Cysteiniphilum halobium TaxID=2219059 RepID=UPI003F8268CE